MTIVWIAYVLVVLVVALVIGRHLGRFTDAYTEMTGMMAGMTMGMLNGFLIGYGAAAATSSMFWGNLFGIIAGLGIGLYYGRPSGLMGIMDGSMGGVMGGSMGAMLAAMLIFPAWTMEVTGVILIPIYVAGMAGLVALIEHSAPEHAARHRLLPMFTRAVAVEAIESIGRRTDRELGKVSAFQLADYYGLLGVPVDATQDQVADAYLEKLATSDEAGIVRLDQALAIFSDPRRREAYDRRLEESRVASEPYARPACCPPKKPKIAAKVTAVDDTSTIAAGVRRSTAVASAKNVVPEGKRANKSATVSGGVVSSRRGIGQNQPVPSSTFNEVVGSGARTHKAQASRTYQQSQNRKKARQQESPISWVGIAVLVFILAVGGGWLLNSGGFGSGSTNTENNSGGVAVLSAEQLKGKATVAPLATDGKQTLDLVVNGLTMSYSPSIIQVKRGVPVHFNLSVEGRDPGCGRFVGVKGLGVHGIAVPGEVAPMEFTPTESGVFEINCSMNMMQRGYLLVTD